MKHLEAVSVKLNKETELKKQWQKILDKIRQLDELQHYGAMLQETTNTLKKQ